MNNISLFLIVILACASCIVPFDPDIIETQELVVISGVITDKPGLHYVRVSRSVAFDEPWVEKPISGCTVSVMDNFNENRSYEEISPGLYEVLLEESYLKVNKSYRIIVISPVGSIYKSELDTLLACPPIESIYFEETSRSMNGDTYPGIQFYNNLKPLEKGARSFRWLLKETWEYKVPYAANYIHEDNYTIPFPGSDFSTCYKTEKVESLFSATTRNQDEEVLHRNPLHFVSNRTNRLSIKYSLLVEQHSLTNTAFNYWSRLRSGINDTLSLYETQPLNIVGNISNETNHQEQVLGFFYASQVQKKRVTVENRFSFHVTTPYCDLIQVHSLDSLPRYIRSYLIISGQQSYGNIHTGPGGCFNCMEFGGVLEKPEYW